VLAVTAMLGAGLVAGLAQGMPRTTSANAKVVLDWTQSHVRRGRHVLATGELVDAAHVIRRSADPDDVVATNRVCQVRQARPAGQFCEPLDFTVSAFTGLRTEVGGWAYSNRVVAEAWDLSGGYVRATFWDSARLAQQTELVTEPTQAKLASAWRERGVRWILADEQASAVSPLLDELAEPVYEAGGVHAYRLRPPPEGS
jgi:hypothetical protein